MPRIVSLISSATEIAYALGFGSHMVGRSHECDYPPEVLRLPCCTRPRISVTGSSQEIDTLVKQAAGQALSIYEIFDDVLEQLQPTHILTQTQCEVCAVSLRDVEESVASRLGSAPEIVALQPNCLADIWEDLRNVARSLCVPQAGERLLEELCAEIGVISTEALAQPERPTVACLEWLQPLMAAGNWMPELVEMAGGVNLFGEAGRHSPWMTWEELGEHDPDLIIAMPCGFDLARTQSEVYWLTNNPIYSQLKAARTGRVYIADGNGYFNRPGPRLLESLRALACALHPALGQPSGNVLRRVVSGA